MSILDRLRRNGSDAGVSSVELVLYAPLILFVTFLAVQFGMVYLGNQVATATAREAARVARTIGPTPSGIAQAEARGVGYASSIGEGLLMNVQVRVTPVGTQEVRATVTADSFTLVPALGGRISQSAQGPVEQFRPDL